MHFDFRALHQNVGKKICYKFSTQTNHCLKSVRIRSYSGPYFPTFGLTTERHSLSLRIHSKFG